MQKNEILEYSTPKTAVEFIITDSNQNHKKVLLFFDTNDEWFTAINSTEHDIISHFAGTIMELAKKDNLSLLIQAQPFKLNNKRVTKSLWCFTPKAKVNGEFVDCIVNQDGTFEVI